MNNLTEKEKLFIQRLEKKNTHIPHLIKKMKISIVLCFALWMFIPAVAMLAFVNEGAPKRYHVLGILSIIAISIALYIHCKNVLRIMGKYGNEKYE